MTIVILMIMTIDDIYGGAPAHPRRRALERVIITAIDLVPPRVLLVHYKRLCSTNRFKYRFQDYWSSKTKFPKSQFSHHNLSKTKPFTRGPDP